MRIHFKGAKVYDGTDKKPRTTDVLVENGRVARVVPFLPITDAERVVDCAGLSLAPGFIDAHSHNDWFVARPDRLRFFAPFLEQGITTQVTGNCGFSPFGWEADSRYKSLIGSGLFDNEKAEGDVSNLSGFCRAAQGRLPLNIHPLVGHMSSRISLAGYQSRPLSPQETARQDRLLERELDMGAGGISFGLMYEPDRYASYEELKRAALLAKRYGRPVTVHARACSAASTSYGLPFGGRPHNLRALDEMLRLTRETGVDLQFSHLIFVGETSWKTADEALSLIEAINAEGHSFYYDSYAMMYGASVITVVLPSWYLTLPRKKRQSALARARLAVEIGVTKKVLGFTFADIQIAWAGEKHRDIVGLTVEQIARRWGVSDLEAYLRLVDDTEGKGRVLMHKYLTPDILARLMSDDRCLYMTDAWIEDEGMQNPAAFGCFPEFLRLARERGTLVRTIRQMTGATADRFRLKDRGYIREGAYADLVLFDEQAVAPGADANGRPMGIREVYVNGELAVENGRAVSVPTAGQFLLR